MARAGGALWLLRHEVRMFWYGASERAGKNLTRRRLSTRNVVVWLTAALLMHLFAFTVLINLGSSGAGLPPQLIIGVTGLMAAALSMMMSTGLKSSVEVLFERGDLDLLLSSPLSSRSIFTVRLGGIVLGIAGVYLFFLAPFAHAGLILGQLRWLGIYPTVLSMAAISASVSMLMTLGLVRLVGVRRTRVIAQILGALSGALFFLLSQLYSSALGGVKQWVAERAGHLLAPGAIFGPESLLWLPGQAVLGAPRPLAVMSLLALAVFFLTIRYTHGFFVHGVQQAVSQVRAARPAGAPKFNFGRRLTHAVLVKEWRLIARDPQIISQVLLQLLYMLPLCALLLLRGGAPLPNIGAALTFLCGSLTGSLAWVIVSAEDAPDLLLAAPCSQGLLRRAKLAAAAIPTLLLVSLPLLWVVASHTVAGLLMCATVVASVATSALIAMWCGRPSVRGDFKSRAKGNFMGNAFELLNGMAWSGLAYLLLYADAEPHPSFAMLLAAPAALLMAFVILGLAWICRRSKY